jgi:PAS domain S-box-containing protein
MANQAMLKLWGKDESVIGRPLQEALPEINNQVFPKLLNKVFTTGESYHAKEQKAELVINGVLQAFYFTFTYKALKDENGKVFGIINTATDITELVEARKKTDELQERFLFALSSAEIGVWDHDLILNKVTWDTRCKELFGFTDDGQVPYSEVLKSIHPDDVEMVDREMMKAIDPSQDEMYNVKFRIVNKETGNIVWLHCKGKAYYTDDNSAFRFAGTAQDITQEVTSRRREQQLLALVNQNSDHMSVTDINGRMLYMNKAARNLLGVEEHEDISVYNAQDFYSPEELERLQHHIIQHIDDITGKSGRTNLINIKTKEEIPFHINYILIRDPETDEIIGRGATGRDIRPEIKAKTELQRLAKIVDSSEDFSNYCDLQGRTVYLNAAGIKLIGIDEDKISKSSIYDYHSEQTNRLIREEILPFLLKEGKWSGQLELLHQKSGEIIPIHKQFYLIKEDMTNLPIAVAGIARDLRPEINARQQILQKNEELEKAIREMEFLANSVPCIVWTSKPDGNLDYLNERWNDLTSMPIADSLGLQWTQIIHPDDKERALRAWKQALNTGEDYKAEFRVLDRNGVYRWYMIRGLPLKDNDGHIIKWYGTNTDVHEQKELENQKDNFLGIASHELKTPVTSIKAYAQVMGMMFRRSGDTKNAELVLKMDKQVNRLSNLIGELLDVTKINTGRLQFNPVEFDFNEMIEEVAEDLQRTTSKHVIRKELKVVRNIVSDKDRVSQVVINLISNAIKYSPNANEIVIYSEDHGHEVQLCVQDFGIGISPDKKDKVFEQFYRVSGSKEYTFPGIGLGLYISSEIVKRLNGRIWVNSVEGKGSTFCFTIPVNQ